MLVFGKQPVHHLIGHHKEKLEQIYLAKEIPKNDYHALLQLGVPVKRIPQNVAQKLAKGGNHQGFLADVKAFELIDRASLFAKERIVLLQEVTDMGNMGALVRSAYALGMDALVIAGINHLAKEALVRSSTAAVYDLDVAFEPNVLSLLSELKQHGYTLYGASMDGEDVRNITAKQPFVLVMGSEGKGLSARLCAKLDTMVKIEMAHGFDSLNVSVAGAILMDRMRDG